MFSISKSKGFSPLKILLKELHLPASLFLVFLAKTMGK
jgi:hypothetical protein